MKNYFLLFAYIFMNLLSKAFGQLEYHQGVGINYINIEKFNKVQAYGFCYNSRLNLLSDFNYSLGLSAYSAVSVARQFNQFTGSDFTFVLDAPILMNLNVGTDATFKSQNKFGYTIGLGYQLLQHSNQDFGSQLKLFSFVALLGFRILLFERPLEVNISYSPYNKVLGLRLVFVMTKY